MTTHVVSQRFTASEALVFYDEHLAHLSEEVLKTSIVAEPSFDPLNDPDLYWGQLGTGDRERWSQYRVPPTPWSHRFLLWLSTWPSGWEVYCTLRCILHV